MKKYFSKIMELNYKNMRHNCKKSESFEDVGFSIYSEFDEDGKLLYIFSLIGATNKIVVDIGSGGLEGSNTANLIINHGWSGLLIDGAQECIDELRNYYAQEKETRYYPPRIMRVRITKENINTTLMDCEVTGNIDLLALDIDGIDYWVLKELNCIYPRVILLEYQCILGPDRAVTVPYDANFQAKFDKGYGIYCGASLSAFVKLLKWKGEYGYRLVGCHKYGFNAFFVRNDVEVADLPEIRPIECFKHPFTRWARETFFKKIERFPWIEV
jgi:hypothetical protein